MDEEILGKVKEILGEYYPNYIIIVLDEVGEVQSDYTTVSVARINLSTVTPTTTKIAS